MSDDIERSIDALRAVRLVQDAYASGPEGSQRVQDIAEMLAMGGNDRALRTHIAAALKKWIGPKA